MECFTHIAAVMNIPFIHRKKGLEFEVAVVVGGKPGHAALLCSTLQCDCGGTTVTLAEAPSWE